MRGASFASALVAVFLASCGGVEPPPAADSLADRFDAPSCRNSELTQMGGESVKEGHRVNREFVANRACMAEVELEMAALDFVEKEPGVYVARRANDWTETVTINRRAGTLKWEEINP